MKFHRTETTENLIRCGRAHGLFGRLEELRLDIIKSLRQGRTGRADNLTAEFIGEYLDCIFRGSPLLDPVNFDVLAKELMLSQEGRDTVRMADLLQYEFPSLGLFPGGVQVTEVSITVDVFREGDEVIFDLEAFAKGGIGKYEYMFSYNEIPDDKEMVVQNFSQNNQCTFRIVPSSNEIRVLVRVRCAGMAERLYYESAAWLTAVLSKLDD